MRWFKHDSNAHSDTKLKRVKNKYGITGYGLYWYCIELIAGKVDAKNITFELEDDAELIAVEWNLDQLKVEEMMRYFVEIKLFEHDNDVITCLKLAKRLDDTNAKNPQIRAILLGQTPTISEELRETPKDSGQIRLEEIRLEENITGNTRQIFKVPPQEELNEYFHGKGSSLDEAEKFYFFYDSKNWMVGKNKMKKWESAASGWISRNGQQETKTGSDFL